MGSADEVTIPAAIDEMPVTVIGDFAFLENKTLRKVILPPNLTAIGEKAF